MPEISRFYGMVIKMFLAEQAPPHIHVVYGEYNAVFDLNSLLMTAGDLPYRGQNMMKEWLARHKDDLLDMWATKKLRKLPPLE